MNGLLMEERDDLIEILDVSGDLASVKVTASDLIDYLHLIDTGEGWKIVNVLWRAREGG